MCCTRSNNVDKESAAINQHSNSFNICIAGKVITVNNHNSGNKNEFRHYLTSLDSPDLVITLSKEKSVQDISQMLNANIPSIDRFGSKVAVMYNYDGFESLLICKKVSDYLLNFGIILMHGAAVSVENKCFVFIAPSGTGKTTHILNWLQMIPGSFVVNGDKPFIDVAKKIVYGSPWSGKERMNINTSVPLSGIIILCRNKTNSIVSISFQEMLPYLFSQVYIPKEQPLCSLVYPLIGQLKNVPCYKLLCNVEKESALVAYNGLLKKIENS